MPFNKFDPRDEGPEEIPEASRRRVWLLKYGWWITMVYTAIGFVFLGLFWFQGNPF